MSFIVLHLQDPLGAENMVSLYSYWHVFPPSSQMLGKCGSTRLESTNHWFNLTKPGLAWQCKEQYIQLLYHIKQASLLVQNYKIKNSFHKIVSFWEPKRECLLAAKLWKKIRKKKKKKKKERIEIKPLTGKHNYKYVVTRVNQYFQKLLSYDDYKSLMKKLFKPNKNVIWKDLSIHNWIDTLCILLNLLR